MESPGPMRFSLIRAWKDATQRRRPFIVVTLVAAGLAFSHYIARSDSGADDVLNLAAFGAVGSGIDDTRVFQAAIDAAAASGKALRVSALSLPYRVQPLFFPSNSRLLLDPGVVIEATPGYGAAQKLLNIENVSNVAILGRGTILRMRRAEYLDGEYRHCIEIQGSSNVRVEGISCSDSGGDGLYIGSGSRGYSSDVVVEDCTFFNHRRQGLTVTSGSWICIRRCSFLHNNGAPPENGIDLEPNTAADRLEHIRIEDSQTIGNQGDGLSIALGKLTARSIPVDISILRHHSDYNHGSGFTASYETNGALPGVAGTILIDAGAAVSNGDYGAVASFFSSSGPVVTFRNLTVYDANQNRVTYDNAAIAIKRGGGGLGPEGNVSFLSPTIIDTTGRLDYYFTLRDYSNVGFAHVQISGSFTFSGAAHPQPYGLVQGQGVNSVFIP